MARPTSGARLVVIVCAAQVFVQLGAGYWPVLLPQLMGRRSLSNSGLAFLVIAGLMALALVAFVSLRPRALEGDR
jgi:hypothetical protein